jgi:hypothetical protein
VASQLRQLSLSPAVVGAAKLCPPLSVPYAQFVHRYRALLSTTSTSVSRGREKAENDGGDDKSVARKICTKTNLLPLAMCVGGENHHQQQHGGTVLFGRTKVFLSEEQHAVLEQVPVCLFVFFDFWVLQLFLCKRNFEIKYIFYD